MRKVCLICKNEVPNGTPIEDDIVIRSIRAIKRFMKIEKKNKIVICKKCTEEYVKRRKTYEKSLTTAIVITVIFFVALLFLSALAGTLTVISLLKTIVYSTIIGILLLGINLFRYVPATTEPLGDLKGKGFVSIFKPQEKSAAVKQSALKTKRKQKKPKRKKRHSSR